MRVADIVKLYFANILGKCCCTMYFPNKKKLQKMYQISSNRIEKELNMVQILQDLRNMNILLSSSLMDKKIKQQILHSEMNIIYLDSSESESDIADICGPRDDHHEITSDPGLILKNLNKSIIKGKQERRTKKHLPRGSDKFYFIANQVTKQVRKNGKKTAYKPRFTQRMAAIILTRWTRRHFGKGLGSFSSSGLSNVRY